MVGGTSPPTTTRLAGKAHPIHGGRFNPPGSFPVLYLCKSRSCAVAEVQYLGERQGTGVEGLLPRVLYRPEVSLDTVLDLTIDQVRAEVGLSLDVLTGPDWTTCQELGVTLHALGAQAINSRSATGVGEVLAVFVQRIGLGHLEPRLVEEWDSLDQVGA